MTYQNKVTTRVIIALLISIIGLPAFVYFNGDWKFFAIATFWGWITNNIAQVGYHRWLCHNHFEASWIGRKVMLFCCVISGLGPPGHHVVAHLNHHAKSDTEEDTHSPVHLGFWNIFLGRYNTPKNISLVQMRSFMKKKDAAFVSHYYWYLYSISALVHTMVNPWLLVWLAFNYTHGFLAFNIQNYFGHSGKEGTPTDLHPVVNFLLLGEGLHSHHHHKPSDPIYGKHDWAGKFLVPLLIK